MACVDFSKDSATTEGQFDVVSGPRQVSRDFILDFERELKKFEQLDLPVKHYFAPGIYMRELFIPAGTCLTGLIHRHEHLNICTGDISVLTESGVKRLTGHHVILSQPGIKRVGYAHADTTWLTVHQRTDDETDIEKLEERYVTDSYEALTHDEVKALWHS